MLKNPDGKNQEARCLTPTEANWLVQVKLSCFFKKQNNITQHELRDQNSQEKERERVNTWLKKREGNAETAILHDCYNQNTHTQGPQKAKNRSQGKKVN